MRGECFEANPACPYRRCFSDTHHEYFYSSDYTSPIEKAFRELPENKVQLCRYEHDELHATTPPPEKPPREEMIERLIASDVHLSCKVRRAINGK